MPPRFGGIGLTIALITRRSGSEVSRAQGEILLDVCAGKAIYERIPFHGSSGMSLEVTRFVAPMLAAFIEVRFADTSEAESFRAPLWFGPELAPEESLRAAGDRAGGVARKPSIRRFRMPRSRR